MESKQILVYKGVGGGGERGRGNNMGAGGEVQPMFSLSFARIDNNSVNICDAFEPISLYYAVAPLNTTPAYGKHLHSCSQTFCHYSNTSFWLPH